MTPISTSGLTAEEVARLEDFRQREHDQIVSLAQEVSANDAARIAALEESNARLRQAVEERGEIIEQTRRILDGARATPVSDIVEGATRIVADLHEFENLAATHGLRELAAKREGGEALKLADRNWRLFKLANAEKRKQVRFVKLLRKAVRQAVPLIMGQLDAFGVGEADWVMVDVLQVAYRVTDEGGEQ